MASIHAVKATETHRADELGRVYWSRISRETNPALCNRKPSKKGLGIGAIECSTNFERVTCKACLAKMPTVETKPPAEKGLTRKEMLSRLAELGYTGPTSYLKPRLAEILAEQEK